MRISKKVISQLENKRIEERLEYLRGEILAERISTGEIGELQSLVKYIDKSDVLLLEWAGVPEFKCNHEDNIAYIDLIQVDGKPFYTVKCESCGEYGTIELEEGENIFGMSKAEIEDFKSGQAI